MKPPVARGPRPGQAPVDPKFARRKITSNADRYAEPEPDPYEEGAVEPTSDEERESLGLATCREGIVSTDDGRFPLLQARPMHELSSSSTGPSLSDRQMTNAARPPRRMTRMSTMTCSRAYRPPSWAMASAQAAAFDDRPHCARQYLKRMAGWTQTPWHR